MSRQPLLIATSLVAAFALGTLLSYALNSSAPQARAGRAGSSLPAGLSVVVSPHSVDATVERLTTVLKAKGMTVFAVIDHSAGAAKAGLQLEPTKLVVFGNPKIGTPLMKAHRTVGIDLPMKMLVWREGGATRLGYNTVAYMSGRHGLGRMPQWVKVKDALANFAKAATGK